jgi:xanthine dehydrogenase/oxidase
VEVVTRRVGGGFGGKLFWFVCVRVAVAGTRPNAHDVRHIPTAAAASVAAVKLGRAVYMHNERVDDMTMMGGREPMEVRHAAAQPLHSR